MARIVKEKAYVVKRNEILEAAQQLVYTKGYEQMTIQDILDSLQISKGAFYHYFDSKLALLEAIIEHIVDEMEEQFLLPIVHDSHLPALEKLQRFFDTLNRQKIAQKDFFLALLRVWYTDYNAIVRQKLLITRAKRMMPLLTTIIRQGIQEGVLTTPFPDQVGEVVLSLVLGLGENIGWLLFSFEPECVDLQSVERTIAAYADALERILGVRSGSLCLVDTETLKEWFVSPGDNA
jgi:AcrR family transcriptional regulator